MKKTNTILPALFIFFLLLTNKYALAIDYPETANIAVERIFNETIKSINIFKKSNKNILIEDVKRLTKNDLMPFIASKFSTKQALSKHWDKINEQQKQVLENYIVNSLIKDYSNILFNFNDFNSIKIKVNDKIKSKGNKAIVFINFSAEKSSNSVNIVAKMINNNEWKIYDVVFSGVSLMKNYESQFNSYIKRKGFERFAKKYLTEE